MRYHVRLDLTWLSRHTTPLRFQLSDPGINVFCSTECQPFDERYLQSLSISLPKPELENASRLADQLETEKSLLTRALLTT